MAETGSVDDAKKVLHKFNRYQAAEYNTTVARCRTAKQWQEFDQPENRETFPNLEWLPSRSVTLRDEHVKFYNRVWAKDDPFWDKNQPGNLWNCKCDWEETDNAVTDGNPTGNINAKGLDGNPARTGEVFTDECTYVKKAGKDAPAAIVKECRNIFRERNIYKLLNTEIGNVLFDKITLHEITKGAKSDKSYFLKQEVALNFDKYTSQLQALPDETIDLSHNKSSSPFYQRKRMFDIMKVYKLPVNDYVFKIKLGKFYDGKLNLYSITEYE